MSGSADVVIDALHAVHDELAPVAGSLTSAQLTGPSAASEWTIAQVLSHLGSGAVIAKATLDAALAGDPNPGFDANREIWARWDSMTPEEQRAGFLEADDALLAAYDALDDRTRATLAIDVGFLPQPVDVATAGRFRLNEAALHSWDVRVALDPSAVVHPDAVRLLLDQLAAMIGFLAKPAALDGRVVDATLRLSAPDRSFGLHLEEGGCALGEPVAAPDAELTASAEAWLRLATGRLGRDHTPEDVTVSGDISLDTLRAVFPGF
ncbi:conserved hypothetical protein [Nostocoides japonicum T1-X7]|uniref:Mycothiol-dependent maleylpyruvate isomerase metal-binding domain-containing protein n=1 Tax=Nostocoides japonicum T1-X7 TaxID=1194083 RepID=A0A077LZY7_9MICO|nr:maleylpyruvate isomerase family mycothiol-dependent enzyme [Tetrasphaera japonica]CCH78437.1 conserved hypothetical protein [Tetrasphaera japonica T1-X7]